MATATEATGAVELSNVGPIEKLTIPCPEDGGVVVLRGRNGSGKSHALEGVESLYSKSSRSGLEKRDGVPSGTIVGMGVTVRLGKMNTARGELVCESLDGRVDPSVLVDPGIKDKVKADEHRIRSLVRLANIKVPPEKWAESLAEVSGVIAIEDLVDDDPVLAADRIRRQLHKVAKSHETLAESKANEGATLSKEVGDVDFSAGCDAEVLSAAMDAASEALTIAMTQQTECKEYETKVANAKAKLEELPELAADDRKRELDEATVKMMQAEEELDEATQRFASAKKLKADAQSGYDDAVKRQGERDSFLSVIEDCSPGDPPTGEQVAGLLATKDAARAAMQNGEVVRRAMATRKKAEQLVEESIETAKLAERYRDLAKSTDTVLEQAMIEAGIESIKIHDGLLCVESDRGIEAFSDLSHGERWSMALDMAAANLPEGSVLPVCQEAFEALDPDNRDQLSKMAKERRLVIVTAEATDGDLRAEVL